jgi:Leucine-rich repeat (LRR) protein
MNIINLESHNLAVVPEEVFLNQDLKVLWLDDNDISTLTEEILRLQELELLSVYKN